jgi:alpha-tubulin suppressor-like RCC1 family protein
LPLAVSGLTDVAKLYVGGAHACAVKKDETVWCWGANARGQLGDGSTTARSFPIKVPLANVVEVVTGGRFTCVRLTDGTVRCAGDVRSDGVKPYTTSFDPVVGLTGVEALRAGSKGLCAITSAGVKCWGLNDSDQLGDGTTTDHDTPTAATHFGVGDLTMGEGHAVTFGTTWAKSIGANDSGQLGIGLVGTSLVTPQTVLW